MAKIITVHAAESQMDLETRGASAWQECATIAEAKRRAKYYLTEEYMNACESTTMLGYSQVRVNGVCEYDYFSKAAVEAVIAAVANA